MPISADHPLVFFHKSIPPFLFIVLPCTSISPFDLVPSLASLHAEHMLPVAKHMPDVGRTLAVAPFGAAMAVTLGGTFLALFPSACPNPQDGCRTAAAYLASTLAVRECQRAGRRDHPGSRKVACQVAAVGQLWSRMPTGWS